MPTEANSINSSTTGLVQNTGTAFTAIPYATGSWTPTMTGATTAGTTTYSTQTGVYTHIGNIVTCNFYLLGSAATGTGNVVIGGLPFTINASDGAPIGTLLIANAWTLPVGTTSWIVYGNVGATTANFLGMGTGIGTAFIQMQNAAFNLSGNITYFI